MSTFKDLETLYNTEDLQELQDKTGISKASLTLYKKYNKIPDSVFNSIKPAIITSIGHRTINGDSLIELTTLASDSIDSLITDPPAGISFMNKEWDKPTNFIKDMTAIYKECLRVLKPGAHGLVWAIPRTSHWTATALEQAGFEIRDVITHHFGSGFPKSLNVGKTLPEFTGIGTALKPASEHWILVRKPLSEPTVAKNVLKYGTGGINIDESRVEAADQTKFEKNWDREKQKNISGIGVASGQGVNSGIDNTYSASQGRFPSNLVFSHNEDCEDVCTEGCPVKELDEQTKDLSTHGGHCKPGPHKGYGGYKSRPEQYIVSEKGGASRFFYCAKASKKDRNAGLEGLPETESPLGDERPSGHSMSRLDGRPARKAQNTHPTVKNTKLMEYLIKLITPPNGVVLDPFMGSGSTGVAAKSLGFKFIGIEKEAEYFDIAVRRLGNVS